MKYRGGRVSGRALSLTLLIALAAFALLSLALYDLSLAALRHSPFRLSRIAAGNIHVDILIVGNSRARDLIVGRPPQLRPTVFNLAYNGLSREDTLEWLRIFFEQGNTAGTVVIETSALYTDQAFCDGKPYWAVYPHLRAAEQQACASDFRTARYFPLSLFNSEQYLRAIYYLLVNRHGDQSWGDEYSIPERLCAHVPLDGIFEFHAAALKIHHEHVRQEISDLQRWLLARGQNVRLVFVLAPFLADPRARTSIADMERINSELLAASENVSLANVLDSDCASFADAAHVGPQGRTTLSHALFASLGYQ
jgi:hypothetical protein